MNLLSRSVIIPVIGFLITALSISSSINAQKVNEDSLLAIIKDTKYDSVRVSAMRKLASYQILHKGDTAEGLALLNKTEVLARKINYQPGICEVLLTRGNYHYRKSDWANAIGFFSELKEQAALVTDPVYQQRTSMMALNNLAGIYSKNGDYTTALDYYFKSRELLEKMTPDFSAQCMVYVNIASHYSMLEENIKAAEYLEKCYPLLDSAKPYLKYLYWSERLNLADKQKNGLQVKSAIDSLEKNLRTAELSDYQKNDYKLSLYDMKGRYQKEYLKNIPQAILEYQKKLMLAAQLGDKAELYNAFYELGACHERQNDLTKAIGFLQKAYTGAKADSINQVVYTSSKLLSKIFYQQKKYDLAYQYISAAHEVNDSIISQKNLEQLNFLEAGYQNAKKEKTITGLKLSNTQKELAVIKRNRLLIITGMAATALLLLLGLMYRSNRQKILIAEKDQQIKGDQIKFLERQQQVVSLQSMVNGQETERTRIAKDLHDGLGGLFSTIKMQLSTLKHEEKSLETNELFQKSYELVDSASVEVRRIAHNMMPEVLIKLGLMQAIQELCNSINAGKLMRVSMQSYGMEQRMNASTEMMLFRIIQELLNNIIKHAFATEAILQFNRDGDRLSVTVEDNGRGFNVQDNSDKKAGLESVKSRVNYLNGKLSIDSEKEIGTTILMDFLINQA